MYVSINYVIRIVLLLFFFYPTAGSLKLSTSLNIDMIHLFNFFSHNVNGT